MALRTFCQQYKQRTRKKLNTERTLYCTCQGSENISQNNGSRTGKEGRSTPGLAMVPMRGLHHVRKKINLRGEKTRDYVRKFHFRGVKLVCQRFQANKCDRQIVGKGVAYGKPQKWAPNSDIVII